jgi:hypothetical protein
MQIGPIATELQTDNGLEKLYLYTKCPLHCVLNGINVSKIKTA